MAPAAAPEPAAAAAARATSANFEATSYQEKARKLVKLVNRLRDAGAQASLDLPSLVVCGNQSAGKSSLLERLCGVKLPRAAGTCTKCPTEVRLFTARPGEGDDWCCHIKLRREFDESNKPLVTTKPEEKAFKTLMQDDKEGLHVYISAAQRALLNPDTPADIFAKEADRAAEAARKGKGTAAESEVQEDRLKFTRNVVVLEITGADVDLALIDLPGIIQSEHASDQGSSNVELVKALVKHYISSPRAIIVATISCKDDMENQAIFSMAQEADPEGLRTIGVLTKVDTIEAGTHHIWLPVLRGQKFPLKLGYYCVVNPSPKDIKKNITLEAAATKETNYFTSHEVFASKDQAGMQKRFGVNALRQQLSQQLVGLTQRELPKMKEAVEEALGKVEAQLSQLPPPPAADHGMELFRRLHDMGSVVQRAVDGEDDVIFFKKVADDYDKLRNNVLAARPTVRLTNAHVPPHGIDTSGLNEEKPEFWLCGPETAQGKEQPDSLITLEGVRALAIKLRVTELPTFQPYRVLEELVVGLKGRWDKAALDCLQHVSALLQLLAEEVVEAHFGQFTQARAYVRKLLYELHTSLMETAAERLHGLMAMERAHVWTNNNHYMAEAKALFQAMLMNQLSKVAVQKLESQLGGGRGLPCDTYMKAVLDMLKSTFGCEFTVKDLGMMAAQKRQRCEHPDDESLLDLIAGALAYLKVSSKRVIDAVPMHINHYLLSAFAGALKDLPVFVQAALQANWVAAAAAAPAADAAGEESDDASCQGTAQAVPAVVAAAGSSHGMKQGPQGDADGGSVLAAAAVRGLQQGVEAAPLGAAQLMAEDESTAQQRQSLQQQQHRLQEARKMLSVF